MDAAPEPVADAPEAQIPATLPPAQRNRRRAWARSHGEGIRSGALRLLRDPWGQLLTLGVVAVALVLPALGFLFLDQIDRAAVSWRPSGDLTIFLSAGEPVERALELADALDGRPEVAEATVRSPDDALAELRTMSDFAGALSALDANPMPALVIVRLTPAGAQHIEEFRTELAQRAEIDWVQVDKRWLERLEALLDLARRIILFGAAILAVAVLLVVGNTIRLEIALKRDEILVLKLLGAADAYVRRPFLYIGLWYGLTGALLALALVYVGIGVVQPAVDRLTISYGTAVQIGGLGYRGALALIAYGAVLGWLGALVASARHLREAVPR
jgi:cell division transport system permease protein